MGLIGLGLVASACLSAPHDATDVPPPDNVETPARPDGGAASSDGAGPDAAACADAFAVAYTSSLDVRPAGGTFIGMLVIAAIGDAVDLSDMVDGADDSFQLELELEQENYDPLPPGVVTGKLDPASADVLIGVHIAPADWTQHDTPTFKLTFLAPPQEVPPPHKATARLLIGGSVATLDFDITYVVGQQKVAVPRAGKMAYSECGE